MERNGKKVRVDFVGRLEDGTEFGSTFRSGEPLEFVMGSHQVLPAFEEVVGKMGVGKVAVIDVPASEAYGEYDETLVEAVSAKDIADADKLPVGEYVSFNTPTGELRVKVAKIEDGMVYFDHNHELAGRDLTFEIRLLGVEGEPALEHDWGIEERGCECGCGH